MKLKSLDYSFLLLFFSLGSIYFFIDNDISFFLWGDSLRQSYPWYQKIFDSYHNLQFPLWDFTIVSGTSFIGELQTSPLYPLLILFSYITIDNKEVVFILAHSFIFSLGVFFYFKKYANNYIAFLFAISISYYGVFFERSLHQPNIYVSFCFFPFILLCFDKIDTNLNLKSNISNLFLLGIIASLMLYAGHTHPLVISFTVAILLFFCDMYLKKNLKIKNIIHLAVFLSTILVVFALISLPQIYYTYEYFLDAYKWYGNGATSYPHVVPFKEFFYNGVSPLVILNFLFNLKLDITDNTHIYNGWLGIFYLLLLSLYLKKNKLSFNYLFNTQSRKILLVISILFILSLGVFNKFIPVIDNVRQPSRWLFGINLMTILLVMHQTNLIINNANFKKFSFLIYFLLTTIVALNIFNSYQYFLVLNKSHKTEYNHLTNLNNDRNLFVLKELLIKDKNLFRFYADYSVVPPNIGNVDSKFMSATGYRSSRQVNYHDDFDYRFDGSSYTKYSIKYYISKDELENSRLDLIYNTNNFYVYEIKNVDPIITSINHTNDFLEQNISELKINGNIIEVFFDSAISGTFSFHMPYHKDFNAINDKGKKYSIYEDDGICKFTIAEPTKSIKIIYEPIKFIKFLYVSILSLMFTLFYILYSRIKKL